MSLFGGYALSSTLQPVAGALIWFDAANTPLGAVASWADKSGNGNNATQGTGANQPANTANQQNGLPALVFNGSSDYLACTVNLPANFTIFHVVAPNRSVVGGGTVDFATTWGDDSHGYELELDNGFTGNSNLRFRCLGDGTILNNRLDNVEFSSFSSNITLGAFHIVSCSRTGATTESALNIGRQISSGVIYGQCTIGEIIIYPRALSVTEMIAVNTYLSQKWGIAIS